MQVQRSRLEEQEPCLSIWPKQREIVPTCWIFALHWRTGRATRITFRPRSGPPACEKGGGTCEGVMALVIRHGGTPQHNG